MTTPDIIASQQVPVVTQDDVAAEWSDDVADPANPPPIISAIQAGQTAMLLKYQQAAAYASQQSDPARATDEYADQCGGERGVYRKPGESDAAYHARTFNQSTVDPNDIVAAANAVLAPFTTKSCVYFEHSDALFLRSDYLDIVDASNATPIVIKVRTTLPTYITNGSSVKVALVTGNTNANGTWNVTIVMGSVVATVIPIGAATPPTVTLTGVPLSSVPIQLLMASTGAVGTATFSWQAGNGPFVGSLPTASSVALTGTGLTAHFGAGTYTNGLVYVAVPSGLSLNTSVGNASYTGGGSALPVADDSSAVPSLWSSHVWGAPRWNTQNYTDRLYSRIADRFSCGARMFSDATGRIFWLVAPEISGIDTSVAALYASFLDVVDASNATPIVITTRTPVPASFANGSLVHIIDVAGNSTANGGPFVVTLISQTSFSLSDQAGNPITGNGQYAGGGSVYRDVSFPSDGFFLGGPRSLPGQVFLNSTNTPQTLDATHTVGVIDVSAPVLGVTLKLPAAPTAGMVVVAWDQTRYADVHGITIDGNGQFLQDPYSGSYVSTTLLHTSGILVMWIWNATLSHWDTYGLNATFVYSISATSSSVYDSVVAAVESIRAHSIRWGFLVDRRLN